MEDQLNGSGPGVLMSEQLAASARVLRRRWRVIALIPLLAIVVSLGLSLKAAKQYTATAKVYIAPTNQVAGVIYPGSQVTPADPERDLNTEVSQITETPMANLVRASLALSENSQDLLAQVSAQIEGTTNIVDIAVTDGDPSRAATIANAFATQYVGFSLAFERRAYASSLAADQGKLAGLTAAELAGATGQQLLKEEGALQGALAVLASNVTVTQNATTPTSPSSPKPLLDAIVAAVVGLLVGIVAAIVLELFDRSVRDEEDAAATARLPSLGVIPRPSPRAGANPRRRPRGPSPAEIHEPAWRALGSSAETFAAGPAALAAAGASSLDWEQDESYSSLAISLLSRRLSAEQNVVLITSPGPQDGKTSVTLGLANALAELGQRVIAVECDLRRPRFAEYLGLAPSAQGLSAILARDTVLPAGLVPVGAAEQRAVAAKPRARSRAAKGLTTALETAPAQLTVLPCGPIPTRPLALLGGPQMAPTLRQLQSMADIVLIDTPPLGVIKDAVVLASLVDQAMLVARVGHTRHDALKHCRDAVDELGTPLVGLVTVGGPRGGVLRYYGRTDGESGPAVASPPRTLTTPERQPPQDAEPPVERQPPVEPQPPREAEQQAKARAEERSAAAAKGSRPRRRGADSVG